MIDINPRETPVIPRTLMMDARKAFSGGMHIVSDNIIFGMPLVAMEAGMAQPGEAVPVLTGRLGGLVLQAPLGGAVAAGLVASVGCPPAAAVIIGTILAGYISTKIENKVIKGLYYVSKAGEKSRHAAFGGDVDDTLTAQKRRRRAMRDMSGALSPARQWLGQEALILHR